MATRKQSGQVFTPHFLVCDMLNIAGYNGYTILQKHIIDNSCGDGAFLQEIVQRYCTAFLQQSSDIQRLTEDLATYIHGIEIDPIAYQRCIDNLNALLYSFHLPPITWDIHNADALTMILYDEKMDFVVGNPPYVRVHNLCDNNQHIKQLQFTNAGMTDLYLAFYEIGLRMLTIGGKLCYITPSSWINSLAGGALRQYIQQTKSLAMLIDLEHFQPFAATTYTMIALFEKEVSHPYFIYCTYIGEKHIILAKSCLSIEEATIGNTIYLADHHTLTTLRHVFSTSHKQYVQVKNGFATLADNVFIGANFPFDKYLIPVIKASTGKWYKAFFPYDRQGKPLTKDEVFSEKNVSEYLNSHKHSLLKGHTEAENPTWFLYGRTQALKDVWADKYAINTLVINPASIKLHKVPKGCGVYSGLYILTHIEEQILRSIIISENFLEYVRTLRHYKSGGYYTFSSKELEQYLNYKLSEYEIQADLFPLK